MRLLQLGSDGELSLTQNLGDNDTIPPYAILSHTWGADNEEVTFKDLADGCGSSKSGYEKILFCGEQAKRDGLQYFWVDTCCINKVNKGELSRAINSMFRWYRDAARCYVYLSDVSDAASKTDEEDFSLPVWESDFRESRWFSRGWTLQELLAPDSVEFFSQQWKRLGDKASLRQQIYEITGIPDSALQGAHLAQFDVEERLSWNEHRHTKLEEDRVYSLLGIFDVYISPFYGEGARRAFERLKEEINKRNRCIEDLRPTDPRDDKKRIEDMKGGLLKDSYKWILDNANFRQWRDEESSRLLWIKGGPGKGKTMLLCGIINELQKVKAKTNIVSFFFCQATDSRINNATAVVRGLLYMLVDQQPSLVSHIRKKYDHAGKMLFEDANAWVALTEIFTNIVQDSSLSSTFLIVDGLDECIADLPKLLQFITQQSTFPRIKWVVSSRNRLDIEQQLERAGHKVRLSLELNSESVSTAVSIFIEQKVSQLAQQKKYNERTRDAVLHHLASNANDTFLWVALVCQSLEKVPRWNVMRKLNAFPPGLDLFYGQMMQQISESDDADLCRQILTSAAIVYRPITLRELASLVELLEDMADDLESIQEIVSLCSSFLTIREATVYFVHQSAKDFLIAKASEAVFPSGRDDAHRNAFFRSLQVLSRTLKRDIYNLGAVGYPIEQVKMPNPDSDPLAASRYSCIYWVDHLCESGPASSTSSTHNMQEGDAIDMFIRGKYLYWLESLSLCKSMSKGVVSMAKLYELMQGRADAALVELVQDARRFIMYHKGAIESSPLQAYMSALLFSPKCSVIRRLFAHEEPDWVTIKPAMQDRWSACVQTLEGHRNQVTSVAFSHNSTWLASASGDSTVKIWDTSSGECMRTLKGHSDQVTSLVFSNDSAWLASTSSDCDWEIKIWDTSNGECMQTLKGHSRRVASLAFSHDSTRLASASGDWRVKIWDTSSGECMQKLRLQSTFCPPMAFSQDLIWLASASYDRTIKIWDTSRDECMQTLKGHTSHVTSVAISQDSTRLASASGNWIIKIWNASSGECMQTLKGYSSQVTSLAFSHDSTRLASTSNDSTVKIWNASSGECMQTLKGHSDWVNSLAFSHDSTWLASASSDRTIKIWDTSSDEYSQMPEGHSGWVSFVVFSHDTTRLRLASASYDSTIKIWDASSCEYVQTLEGHSSQVTSVAFSHSSNLLASASGDSTVKIWDANSGKCKKTLEGHSDRVTSVAFSRDSNLLVSASYDRTIKIWDTNSGEYMQTLKGHTDQVTSLAFSNDSAWLASASGDRTIKIWDANSGKCKKTLEGHSNRVNSVAFSHDSTQLASASYDRTVKIWDASNGECEKTFNVSRITREMSFSPTGSCLYTEIGTITINGTIPQTTHARKLEPPEYQGFGVGLNWEWITYNNENILWLPSEYRPSCQTILGNTIGVGVGSGKVWTCSFTFD